jgi:hypothetical protein
VAAVLTHKIDSALDALDACRARGPALRDCYRPGRPERAALDELLAALDRAVVALARAPVDARPFVR